MSVIKEKYLLISVVFVGKEYRLVMFLEIKKTRNNASLVKNASNILLTISVGNKNISI